MTEIWKDIKGYEGLYQVSNLGHVKSLNYNGTKKEKNLSIGTDKYGYQQVALYKNKTLNSFKVHRLVANAFLENPENFPQVNHIDQNKQNNRVDNLEFCTAKYNKRYSAAKKVGCFKNGKLIKIYDVMQDAMKDGFQKSAICCCCKEKYNSHAGFQWKYLN